MNVNFVQDVRRPRNKNSPAAFLSTFRPEQSTGESKNSTRYKKNYNYIGIVKEDVAIK